MPDWADLDDAYGSAEQTPALIASAIDSGTEFGNEWDEVWGRLCHQGTVYSASYAAIPLLAEAARQHEPAPYIASLHLAGSILGSRDGAAASEPVRSIYRTQIAEMRELALRCLRKAADDRDFIYGLQTLAAFEDAGVWQRSLSHLADGELPLECPWCGEALLVDLESDQPRASDWIGSMVSTPVTPHGAAPDTPESRLIDLTRDLGHERVAERLLYLFGRVTCPSCDAAFDTSAAL